MQAAFDKKTAFKHLESSTRRMVETSYDHCTYKCNQNPQNPLSTCKGNCYKNIIVPFKLLRHQGHNDEENLYKECLAKRFPNLKPDDYVDCTNDVYGARAKILMTQFINTAENLLDDLH